MKSKQLTQERLKELLNYDPDTGVFTWKVSPHRRIKVGSIAGSLNNGYSSIGINKKSYKSHRLAWLYMCGYFPKNIDIDHKNRVRYHNQWNNLRLISHQCNAINTSISQKNTSGVTGVYWRADREKWRASITINGNPFHIGYFSDFNEAVLARLSTELCLSWDSCNDSSSAYQYAKKHNLIKF